MTKQLTIYWNGFTYSWVGDTTDIDAYVQQIEEGNDTLRINEVGKFTILYTAGIISYVVTTIP